MLKFYPLFTSSTIHDKSRASLNTPTLSNDEELTFKSVKLGQDIYMSNWVNESDQLHRVFISLRPAKDISF